MIEIIPIDTESLGDRSYLAHDGTVALVVDPQRDIDRVLALADEAGVTITDIVETHIHNDYVTGGLALARATGARYHVNEADPVAFERVCVRDGQELTVGDTMSVRVIATPGHTFTHLSYALSADGETLGVFTGGSLLYGTTGRPDLLGKDKAEELAHHQYASARRLVGELPDSARVLPTHGFGSFCASSQSKGDSTDGTLGGERRGNPVLSQDEEEWVADLLAGLDAYPAYYAHMGPANSAGPDAPDLTAPEPADKEVLRRRIESGEWVVDLRGRQVFAAGHVPGTFNLGLDGQFATYLGWLLPWGTPLTLLGASPEQVATAQRELVRIGIDRLAGAASGQPTDWTDRPLASYPRATFAELNDVRHHRAVEVLDVRLPSDFAAAHIVGATHIPLHELMHRMDDLPAGELWVHCAGGYRAGIASSLLVATGRPVVHIDDAFENAEETGLPME